MQVQLPVWLWVLGRILFVSYFVAMGTSHILKFRDHSAHLARKHVPLPRVVTVLTFVMMVGGGMSILFNWHPVLGAVLLFGIIFPAPFYLHRFWNETDWYMRLSEFPWSSELVLRWLFSPPLYKDLRESRNSTLECLEAWSTACPSGLHQESGGAFEFADNKRLYALQ